MDKGAAMIFRKLENKQKPPRKTVNRRLFIAFASLLIIFVMQVAVSFAWLSLSASPGVEGIATTVAANGSLEIALLSDSTYLDPVSIQSGVNTSLAVADAEIANQKWGSLIDLHSEAYGLQTVRLVPTTLNVRQSSSRSAAVGQSLLLTPEFGTDGRITELHDNSVSGTFSDGAFTVDANRQSFGVRGIGSADVITVQQRTLLSSVSYLHSLSDQAASRARATLRANSPALIRILDRRLSSEDVSLSAEELNALFAMLGDYTLCIDEIEQALRQGIIAIAASQMSDPNQFTLTHKALSNERLPLLSAINYIPGSFSGVASISRWIEQLDQAKAEITRLTALRSSLSGGADWSAAEPLILGLSEPLGVYFGDTSYVDSTALQSGATVTMMPGSGFMAMIADYVGNYDAFVSVSENSAVLGQNQVSVRTEESTARLSLLYGIVSVLDAANAVVPTAEITDTEGYAIDLAFRVNADNASLLLQTDSTQRVYDDIEATNSGSYLTLLSSELEEQQVVELLDAIRVTFVDSCSGVLAMAKLNVSNYFKTDTGELRAPLYLYDFDTSGDTVLMGERRDTDPVIAALPQNEPFIVTAIVWLDGASIGNSGVSTSGLSVCAELNLQFRTDAELLPVNDSPLRDAYAMQPDA